jgi:hypothetical protein
VEVVLKGGGVEDAVGGGAGAVDGEAGAGGGGGFLHVLGVRDGMDAKKPSYQLGHEKFYVDRGIVFIDIVGVWHR